MKFINTLKKYLKAIDIEILRNSTFEKTNEKLNLFSHQIGFLKQLNSPQAQKLITYLDHSNSQLLQDLFVLSTLNFKKNGYFIEFGATNGINLSNTYLMEKHFGWSGILAEPAIIWHKDLKNNRKCNIETSCVWKDSSSTLEFNEVLDPELSTINNYSNKDAHRKARKKGRKYDVKTISLNDLLLKYKAPKLIDYLSIDTEGSEYEILSNFNFSNYEIQIITCEHNYTEMREKIYLLLKKQGYKRVFESLSIYDDWYIKN